MQQSKEVLRFVGKKTVEVAITGKAQKLHHLALFSRATKGRLNDVSSLRNNRRQRAHITRHDNSVKFYNHLSEDKDSYNFSFYQAIIKNGSSWKLGTFWDIPNSKRFFVKLVNWGYVVHINSSILCIVKVQWCAGHPFATQYSDSDSVPVISKLAFELRSNL